MSGREHLFFKFRFDLHEEVKKRKAPGVVLGWVESGPSSASVWTRGHQLGSLAYCPAPWAPPAAQIRVLLLGYGGDLTLSSLVLSLSGRGGQGASRSPPAQPVSLGLMFWGSSL